MPAKKTSGPSPARVRELLYWDAAHGHFAWRATSGRALAGVRAGSLRSGTWRIGIDGQQYTLAAVIEAYGALPTDPAPVPLSQDDSAVVREHKLAYNTALTRLKAARDRYMPLLEKARMAKAELDAQQAFVTRAHHELTALIRRNPY